METTSSLSPLISVVVPIYNVERYLRQCVDSILNQTLHNIEVILVDDGSPDSCPAIVDEYAAKDSRVVAVHQSNGGYGKAVNHGISLARAPYIGIIESDDWIEPTMYEKLYARACETGADWVRCMHWAYNSLESAADKRNILWAHPIGDLRNAPDGVFTVRDWDKIFLQSLFLWAALYKSELIRKVPLLETSGAAYQDAPFMIEMIAVAKSISVVKEPLVHYRREPNQCSSCSGGGKRGLQVFEMSQVNVELMERYGLLKQYKEACYYRIFISNLWGISITGALWQEEYYRKFYPVAKRYAEDPCFTWKYFSKAEKQQALALVNSSSFSEYQQNCQDAVKEILCKSMAKYRKILFRYRMLQLRWMFSWGRKRQKLKQEKLDCKQNVRELRHVINTSKTSLQNLS